MPEMSPLDAFFRGKGIFVPLPWRGYVMPVAPTHIYRKYHISRAFDKDHLLSFSAQRKNIIFSGRKKYHLSRYYKKELFGKTIFSEHLKKISYFQVKEDLKKKIIFSGKINARIIIISLQSSAYQEYSVYCIV